MMNTSQKLMFLVEGTKGNVSIVNNEISQLATSIQSCVEKQQVTTKIYKTYHLQYNKLQHQKLKDYHWP